MDTNELKAKAAFAEALVLRRQARQRRARLSEVIGTLVVRLFAFAVGVVVGAVVTFVGLSVLVSVTYYPANWLGVHELGHGWDDRTLLSVMGVGGLLLGVWMTGEAEAERAVSEYRLRIARGERCDPGPSTSYSRSWARISSATPSRSRPCRRAEAKLSHYRDGERGCEPTRKL